MSVDVSSDFLVGRMGLVEGELVEVVAVCDEAMVCRRVRDNEVLAGDAPVALFPKFGDRFRLPSDEAEVGVWIEAVPPSGPSQPVQARAWFQGDVLTVPLDRIPAVEGEASGELREVLRALVQEQQGRQQDKAAARDRLEWIVAILHEEADDRGMCSEFDDAMERVGLPRRVREYEFRVELRTVVFVTGRGTDEDDAWDAVTLDVVHSEVDLCGLEVYDYNVT